MNIIIHHLNLDGSEKQKTIMGGAIEITDEDLFEDENVPIDVLGSINEQTKLQKSAVYVFPEDTVSILKEKIYFRTGIPPFCQHLFIQTEDSTYNLSYIINTLFTININYPSNIKNTTKQIYNIPIDLDLYQNRNLITVEASDDLILVGDLYNRYSTTDYYLVNLEDLKSHVQLQSIQKNQLEMLFYGFVIKYWPQLTYHLFQMWIDSLQEFKTTYPDLYGTSRKLDMESSILLHKYDMIKNPSKKLSKYSIKIFGDKLKGIKRQIPMMQFKIKSIGNYIHVNNLFNLMHTSPDMPIIKIFTYIPSRMVLTKIVAQQYHKIYNSVNSIISLKNFNSILFLIIHKEIFITVIIDYDGTYYISCYVSQEDIEEIKQIVISVVNPLMEHINSYKRKVLAKMNIPLIKENNLILSKMNINITINITLDDVMFKQLHNQFLKNESAGIISDVSYNPGVLQCTFIKGITPDKNNIVDKGYSYLTNIDIKTERKNAFKFKTVIIHNHHHYILLQTQDVNYKELQYIYEWFIVLCCDIEPSTKEAKRQNILKTKNALKLSKEKDPKLYDMKLYGSKLILSRVIQKKIQPYPYTKEEYELLPNTEKEYMHKYWNFTTNQEMYYKCSKKYPHIGFITNKHPKGYCLPICRKADIIDTGKKKVIYNTCMDKHIYDDTIPLSSRHIILYGKNIPQGRICYLPTILSKYIRNNIKPYQSDIIYDETIEFAGNIYSVKKMYKMTKNNRVFEIPLNDLIYELDNKTITYGVGDVKYSLMDIIKNPTLSTFHYEKIMNSSSAPVLCIKQKDSENKYKVIVGIYYLARAYLFEYAKINVKFVTKKQLHGSLISVVGGAESIKSPNYLLYGTPQTYNFIVGVGGVNALLNTLNISMEQFIKDMSGLDFNLLTKYTEMYFSSLEELIEITIQTFLQTNIVNDYPYWNELFIEMVKIIYDKYVIILEISYTETNVNIITPFSINEANDLILTDNNEQYILLLKSTKADTSSPSDYYPIYTITPFKFYKNRHIDKKFYNFEDPLMMLIHDLLHKNIENAPSIKIFNLKTATKWMHDIGIINKYYVSQENNCYYIGFKIKNKQYFLPIYNTFIDESLYDNKLLYKEPLYKNDITQSRADLLHIVNIYNEWAKTRNYMSILFTTQHIYNNKAIGFIYDKMNFYHTPAKVDSHYKQNILFYDPDIKMKLLFSNNLNNIKTILPNTYKIQDEYNEYNEYIIDVLYHWDKERNNPMRKEIRKLLSNDVQNLSSLNINESDMLILQSLIKKYSTLFMTKQMMLKEFDENVYDFDKLTLSKIRNILEKNDTKSSEIQIKKIIKQVKMKHNKKLLNLLVQDFLNPIKNKLLLSGIYNWISDIKFHQSKNEKIFIKV